MMKNVSYVVPNSFRKLFIAVGVAAYLLIVGAYISILVQDVTWQHMEWQSGAPLIGAVAAPLVAGAIGAIATHRRGWSRWWVAVGLGYVGAIVWNLSESALAPTLSTILVPETVSLLLTAGIAVTAVWLDRTYRPATLVAAQWRVYSGVALYVAIFAQAFYQGTGSMDIGQYLMVLLMPVGILLVFVLLTLLVYRRMPGYERAKRVLLLMALIVLGGSVLFEGIGFVGGYSMTFGWIIPVGGMMALYVIGAYLLRSQGIEIHQG